jgi:hypothetical protein
MKTSLSLHSGRSVALLALVIGLFSGAPAFAASDHHDHGKDSAGAQTSAEAIAAYPLSTCVVSDEKLEGGDMGGPIDYIYKEEGKPDRLVRFCCKSCIKDFKKDPAKYIKMIDEAAAAKAKAAQAGH